MAQQLIHRGHKPDLLLFDMPEMKPEQAVNLELHRPKFIFVLFAGVSRLLYLGSRVTKSLLVRLGRRFGLSLPTWLREQVIYESDALASSYYIPKSYAGNVAMFWAAHRSERSLYDLQKSWDRLMGTKATHIRLSGSHTSIFQKPHVGEFAKEIKTFVSRNGLSKAQSPRSEK